MTHELTVAKDGRDFAHLIADVEHYEDETGKAVRFHTTNGYEVSVARGMGTYGGRDGLFEMAIFKDGDIDYDTPTCPNDVVGWLTNERVITKLRRFANFTAEDLNRYKKFKAWRRALVQLDESKGRIVQLWQEVSGQTLAEDGQLPFDLRKAMESLDKAFLPHAPEDPGIEDDVDD